MNKTELNKYVRDVLAKNMKKSNTAEADHIINTFIESIITALKENDEIALLGFGKFYKAEVKARIGRNPKTGEALEIKAYTQPRFTAGKTLKDACNQGRVK